MTDITALIRELVDAGCDPIIAGSVVARALATGASTAPFRARSGAERQSDYRARKQVTKSDESDENVTSVTRDYISSSTLSESEDKKEKEVRKKGRGVGEPLPSDWSPNADHFEKGLLLGHSEAEIRDHAEDMRLWAESRAPPPRKISWDKTFTGWLRRSKPRAQHAKASNAEPNSWQASRDRWRAAHAELGEAIARSEDSDSGGASIIQFGRAAGRGGP